MTREFGLQSAVRAVMRRTAALVAPTRPAVECKCQARRRRDFALSPMSGVFLELRAIARVCGMPAVLAFLRVLVISRPEVLRSNNRGSGDPTRASHQSHGARRTDTAPLSLRITAIFGRNQAEPMCEP